MRSLLWLPFFVLTFFPVPLQAETLKIVPGVVLQYTLPAERWTVAREAPEFLIEETAEHLEHELAAQGKRPDAAALKAAATRRLAANEVYIFNPDSGAYLAIDFSALREGEKAPGRGAIAESARLAGESLESEEGTSDVRHDYRKAAVPGAEIAYRVDATFRHHDESRRFIGVIGFRAPYWFYLYYTDPLQDAADSGEMEEILRNLVLLPGVD